MKKKVRLTKIEAEASDAVLIRYSRDSRPSPLPPPSMMTQKTSKPKTPEPPKGRKKSK